MKNKKILYLNILFLLCTICLSFKANAQFYQQGDDRGSIKWMNVNTKHYELIYPNGMDSLAYSYGYLLEKFFPYEESSIGFYPVDKQWRKRTPVVLHSYNSLANGSVAWAPIRIDLFSMPATYEPVPTPWDENLVIHESRHASQMQFTYSPKFIPLDIILGQMFNGALAGIYPGPALLEGDAVATETALSKSGRGRTADFLNYYMYAFDNGDYRNWYRWRWGSNKYYAPNHYALGYLTVAGMRYFYDDPFFMKKYFESVAHRPLKMRHMQKTMKKISGKSFNETFQEIMTGFHDIWEKDASQRSPFMPSKQFSKSPKGHTEYSRGVFARDNKNELYIYSLKNSMVSSAKLVKIDRNGNEKDICHFDINPSKLTYSEKQGRIYWSESVPDIRWGLDRGTTIRYMDMQTGKRHRLTPIFSENEHRYVNPCPSETSNDVLVIDYPVKGGSAIAILDAESGKEIINIPAPNGIQIVEAVYLNKEIYCSGLSRDGFAIYHLIEKKQLEEQTETNEEEEIIRRFTYKRITESKPVKIHSLRNIDGNLQFVSDRTGVNELYVLDIIKKEIHQVTNTKYGVKNCLFSSTRDTLYYTYINNDGYVYHTTESKDLLNKKINFSECHEYKVANKLSEQERILIEDVVLDEVDEIKENSNRKKHLIKTSPEAYNPKKYKKMPHWLRFHSWAPVYFNLDRIKGESFDFDNSNKTSLGATALFQNTLGTASGYIGYSTYHDLISNKWKHSGHLKFRYSGLFPVFEATIDYNDRDALSFRKYRTRTYKYGVFNENRASYDNRTPMLSANILTYVPINLSKNGWNRGIIPQFEYRLTNDEFDKSNIVFQEFGYANHPKLRKFIDIEEGKKVLLQTASTSLRAYNILPKAEANIFPKWGIGAEVGMKCWLGLSNNITPNIYSYVYGYTPGFMPKHGFKFTGTYQKQLKTNDNTIKYTYKNMLPRGLSSNAMLKFLIQDKYNFQAKFTAEYAMPLWLGDWSNLSPVAYIKNIEIIPHIDYLLLDKTSLYSVGSTFGIHFGQIAWFPYECSLGVCVSYNGGRLYDKLLNGDIINKSLATQKIEPKNYYELKRIKTRFTFRISM